MRHFCAIFAHISTTFTQFSPSPPQDRTPCAIIPLENLSVREIHGSTVDKNARFAFELYRDGKQGGDKNSTIKAVKFERGSTVRSTYIFIILYAFFVHVSLSDWCGA